MYLVNLGKYNSAKCRAESKTETKVLMEDFKLRRNKTGKYTTHEWVLTNLKPTRVSLTAFLAAFLLDFPECLMVSDKDFVPLVA